MREDDKGAEPSTTTPLTRETVSELEQAQDSREGHERVYIIKQTLVESYYYEPAQIKEAFGDMWDAYEGSFDDFIIGLFEEHNGSEFHGKWFHNDANPSVWCELEERWDDE